MYEILAPHHSARRRKQPLTPKHGGRTNFLLRVRPFFDRVGIVRFGQYLGKRFRHPAHATPDPAINFTTVGSIMPLNIARDKYRRQLMTCDSSPRAWEYLRHQKTLAFCTLPPAPTDRVASKTNSTTLLEVCGIFADFSTGEPAKPPIFSASHGRQ